MAKILLLLFLVTGTTSVQSQDLQEWLRQQETQKKYLLQQIAALKTYKTHIQKGYKIAREGLRTISQFMDGEFKLHQDYFQSLEKASPAVSQHPHVESATVLLLKIEQGAGRLIQSLTRSNAFTKEEMNYIQRTLMRLLHHGATTIGTLHTVTGGEGLQMTDKARLEKVEHLYRDMQDHYTFLQSFSGETRSLMALRKMERLELQRSRTLRGLK